MSKKSAEKNRTCGKTSSGIEGRTGNLGRAVKDITRPQRTTPRHYSAKDAGRIICYAVGSGASKEEIVESAGCCLGNLCERERSLLERILSVADAISTAIGIAALLIPLLRVLPRLLSLPFVGRLLSRLLPALVAAKFLGSQAKVIDLAATEWRVLSVEIRGMLSKSVD